jgi:hypothetical protein
VQSSAAAREAARRFAISPSAAIKLMQRVRATGSAAPARSGGRRRRVLERHETELRRLVEVTPDLTLALRSAGRALDDPQRAPGGDDLQKPRSTSPTASHAPGPWARTSA